MCPGVWTVQCLRIFVSYGFYTELRGNKQETNTFSCALQLNSRDTTPPSETQAE